MALRDHKIAALIPAFNEEQSIGLVVSDLPDYIDHIIVCDNGSTDNTALVAREAGATVVSESTKGYGSACLRAFEDVPEDTDILLYVDGDRSDFPEEADRLIMPIIDDAADLVVGSRMITLKGHKALPPAAVFGNWLTSRLIRLFWHTKFTDIGPFRAIRYSSYQSLQMRDRNFGWTVEMQVKAVKRGLRCREVPVSYRKRAMGDSKVSGTIVGSLRAGTKFLWIVLKEALQR